MYSTQNFHLYLTVIITKLDFNTSTGSTSIMDTILGKVNPIITLEAMTTSPILDCTHKDMSASANIAAEIAKQHYDLQKKPAHEYKPGDQVWLEASNLKSIHPSKKLGPKHYGPFNIIEKCYDVRSQYFPQSVMAHRFFFFFLSFPLDYITDLRIA